MEKKIAKNITQLVEIWKSYTKRWKVSEPDTGYYGFEDNEDGFKNVIIDFNLFIPFESDIINTLENHLGRNIDPYKFKDCIFKKHLKVHNRSDHYVLAQNCFFEDELKVRFQKSNLTFFNCSMKNLNFENAVFGIEGDNNKKGKVRFHNCSFYKTNFRNATFNKLADFWHSTFNDKVIFYKTDFLETTVFSGVTFKENVLFTYTLIDKILILRGAKPLKGFDLSLTILSGKLSLFDFRLRNYEVFDVLKKAKEKIEKKSNSMLSKTYEVIYENSVSVNADIPPKNRRETYRILKNHLESQNNILESLSYKTLEKDALRQELVNKKSNINKEDSLFKKIRYKAYIQFDRFNLWCNWVSNNYGTSYARAFVFISLTGWFFFYCSLIATDSFEFSINPKDWEFTKGLGYFIQFLLPTHKFNYMGEEVLLTSTFYVFDFLGRTFVGYGIYQFIQAFRKFR